MSESNPFEKPVQASTAEAYQTPESQPSGPVSIPTSLMVISIIGILLSLLSLSGVCFQGAALAMTDMMMDMMPDEETKDAMRKLMDLQFIPMIAQLALSLVVAPLLLVGCIGCLTRKPWSRGLMKIGIIGSMLLSIMGLGILAWITLFHWETLAAPNANQPGGEMMSMVGHVIGVGYQLIVLGFLVWALIAIGSQKTAAFYERIK